MNAADMLLLARWRVSDRADITDALTVTAVLRTLRQDSLAPWVVDAVGHDDGLIFGRAALEDALRANGVTARHSDITRAAHEVEDFGLPVVARSEAAVSSRRRDMADRRFA